MKRFYPVKQSAFASAAAPLLCFALAAPVVSFAQSSSADDPSNAMAAEVDNGAGRTASKDSDWQIRLGGGMVSTPRFIGASKQRYMVVPTFDIRYRDWFFANPVKGVGVEAKPLTGLSLTAALGVSTTSRNSDMDSRLNGLPKIGAAPNLKLGAEYEINDFTLSGEFSSRLTSGTKAGSKARLEAAYNLIASKSILLSAGVFEQLMDRKYATNFLSISAQQSAITGLPTYEAKRGALDNGVFAQALYRLDDKWLVFSKVDVARLASNAANSPIVQKRNQTTVLFFVTRAF